MPQVELRVPDLGLPEQRLRLTVWHVKKESQVERDQPIVELTAGAVTIDLPAPASGVLAERLAAEDDLVAPGDPVAMIETPG